MLQHWEMVVPWGCMWTVTPPSRGVSAFMLRKPLGSFSLYPYVLNLFLACAGVYLTPW